MREPCRWSLESAASPQERRKTLGHTNDTNRHHPRSEPISNAPHTLPIVREKFKFNTTVWGWIHIILGVLLAAIAIGLIRGTDWARVAAIVIASVSIVVMFLWLPYYPVWSLVVIALDVIVIWAVTTWDNGRAR